MTPRTASTIPRAGSAAIVAEDLVKTYRGDVRALAGLSLTVEAGTVFGLLGPNGAGKSTAVKVLTTLTRPDSGRAQVAGVDVLRSPQQVRRLIGCVSQASGLDPQATGAENLWLAGRLQGLGGATLRHRVDTLLEHFALTEAAGRLVRTYSGGMRRKLDVAVGLVHLPPVLFLDEPTTGLDPQSRAEMWAEITRLSSEDGLTVLLTTHYLEEADQLAADLAIIDRGRVVAAGTPEGLKSELHGDTVAVILASHADHDGERAQAALSDVAGIVDVTVEGDCVRARARAGASAVPAVLAALDVAGLPVAAVSVARPSLDDVYLRYAGRSYAAASAAQFTEPRGAHTEPEGARR